MGLFIIPFIVENEWNIRFNPFLNNDLSTAQMPLIINGKKYTVKTSGRGSAIQEITLNGKALNSCIIPEGLEDSGDIRITLGESQKALLIKTNSRVISCSSEPERMRIKLRAYPGKAGEVVINCPTKPEEIVLNDQETSNYSYKNNVLQINFQHQKETDLLTVYFEKRK